MRATRRCDAQRLRVSRNCPLRARARAAAGNTTTRSCRTTIWSGRPAASSCRRCRRGPRVPPRASADETGDVDRPALATENAGGLYHLGATFVDAPGNVDPRVTLLPLDATTARDFAAQLEPRAAPHRRLARGQVRRARDRISQLRRVRVRAGRRPARSAAPADLCERRSARRGGVPARRRRARQRRARDGDRAPGRRRRPVRVRHRRGASRRRRGARLRRGAAGR